MTTNEEPLFALCQHGVTVMDEHKLRELASGRAAMQPFFAVAILRLMEMLERGELRGVEPNDLFIGITRKA